VPEFPFEINNHRRFNSYIFSARIVQACAVGGAQPGPAVSTDWLKSLVSSFARCLLSSKVIALIVKLGYRDFCRPIVGILNVTRTSSKSWLCLRLSSMIIFVILVDVSSSGDVTGFDESFINEIERVSLETRDVRATTPYDGIYRRGRRQRTR